MMEKAISSDLSHVLATGTVFGYAKEKRKL
jgi:hypothetical protein